MADPPKFFGGGCANMYYVYVLQSRENYKRYVGFTRRDVFTRLKEHNFASNQWTRTNRPFDLLFYEEYSNETFARKRERFLKSGRGREFLKKIFPRSSAGRASGCAEPEGRGKNFGRA